MHRSRAPDGAEQARVEAAATASLPQRTPDPPPLSPPLQYDAKLCKLLDTYDRAFLVHADNVGSKQFMDIRRGLREHSVVLMGKNTMMKRSVRLHCEKTGDDKWAILLDVLIGNVGLVFTKGDLGAVRDEIVKFKVGAPARVGLVAPNSVTVPAGNTGLDPSSTSFFQALNIPTKINRGTVEIVSDVALIKEGDKVGGSEATLLAKLGIRPFSYGLVVKQVLDGGAMYDPQVLDITDADLLANAAAAVNNVAAVSLALGFPTAASVVHDLVRGYKNALAVAVATDYSFPQAEKILAFLANPSAFAAPAAAEASGGGGGESKGSKKEAKKVESESESDGEMGMGLFGDD